MSESFLNNCFNLVTTVCSYLIVLNAIILGINTAVSPKHTHSDENAEDFPHMNVPQLVAFLFLFVIVILPIWIKTPLGNLPSHVLTISMFTVYTIVVSRFIKILLFMKDISPLDKNDQYSLFIFSFVFFHLLKEFDFTQVYNIASAASGEVVKSLILLFASYLLSAVSLFSLLVYPMSFFATSMSKISPRISSIYRITQGALVKKLDVANEFTPFHSKCRSPYSRKKRTIATAMIVVPVNIALDILCYMLLYAFQIFIIFPLSVILYILSICGNCLLFLSQRMAKISSRRAIFFSFRCSIVIAATLVVITVRVLSVGHPDTVASIVEFIASVIIIPIMFQWIQSILEEWRNSKVRNGTNDTSPPTT